LIAELGLTSNQSAASRRDAPDSTASTTRSRNSKEHGFGIDPPSKTRINARQIQLSKPAGESRFNSAEIRSNCPTIGIAAIAECGLPPPRIVIGYRAHQAQVPNPVCPFSF
jgi:hypothetical protein